MSNSKFIITDKRIENSPIDVSYSPLELYHTIRIDSDGKKTFDGDVSEYLIKNGVEGIPSEEVIDWMNAVSDMLYEHNDKLDNNTLDLDIKFDIKSVDSRYAYEYDEIVNGTIIKSGVDWGLNFENQAETDAWIDAVIEFNKKNGIELPTDKIKKKLDKIKEYIDSLDLELPEYEDLDIPMVASALPTLTTDPCEFYENVKKTVENLVATIYLMPSPKDIINYNIKIIKANLYIAVARTVDGQLSLVKPTVDEAFDKIPYDNDYWREVCAYRSQIIKEMSEEVYTFETALEPPVRHDPINLSYNGAENTEDNNGPYINSSDIPKMNLTSENSSFEYRELTVAVVYNKHAYDGTTAQERLVAKSHVKEALWNCWVPLKKAWNEYAQKNGIDPQWDITSGWRPPNANKGVGVSNSAHLGGYAIDIQFVAYQSNPAKHRQVVTTFCNFAYSFFHANNIKYDQILREKLGIKRRWWAHIGYKKNNGEQRNQPVIDINPK